MNAKKCQLRCFGSDGDDSGGGERTPTSMTFSKKKIKF